MSDRGFYIEQVAGVGDYFQIFTKPFKIVWFVGAVQTRIIKSIKETRNNQSIIFDQMGGAYKLSFFIKVKAHQKLFNFIRSGVRGRAYAKLVIWTLASIYERNSQFRDICIMCVCVWQKTYQIKVKFPSH